MLWGFEHRDGWFDIILRLFHTLSSIALVNKIDIKAKQIKEKFGTLRFYYTVGKCTSRVYTVINNAARAAKAESNVTCEDCGKLGQHKIQNS